MSMPIPLSKTEYETPVMAVKQKVELINNSMDALEMSISGIGRLLSEINGEPINDDAALPGSPTLSHMLRNLPERIDRAALIINNLVSAVSQELF